MDPVELARALIRCRSVTPQDDGCLALVGRELASLGFSTDIFDAGGQGGAVTNLIACRGTGGPVFAFAGHTDVVPVGNASGWQHDPFAGAVVDGTLYGRGAVDMKGAVAAFVGATQRYVAGGASASGTLLVLLTGDEEEGGPSGMRAILRRMQGRTPTPDACLIGEPSSEESFGQGIRIGRRGSLNVEVTVRGRQGHVAWPQRADNALHRLLEVLHHLRGLDLGPSDACIPASNLEVTSVRADSQAANIIPGLASARLNVRFNRHHSGASLAARLAEVAGRLGEGISLAADLSGEPYLQSGGGLAGMVADEVERVVGRRPDMNAGGGVSDGRFLRALCPVIEFGLVGDRAHQVDERVPVRHLLALTDIYHGVLRRAFDAPSKIWTT